MPTETEKGVATIGTGIRIGAGAKIGPNAMIRNDVEEGEEQC
jgi:glucose-1-phosphate adenylyltransferase